MPVSPRAVILERSGPAFLLESAAGTKPVKVTLYATRSWDYGVVRFSINGTPAGEDVDLFSGERGKALADAIKAVREAP